MQSRKSGKIELPETAAQQEELGGQPKFPPPEDILIFLVAIM